MSAAAMRASKVALRVTDVTIDGEGITVDGMDSRRKFYRSIPVDTSKQPYHIPDVDDVVLMEVTSGSRAIVGKLPSREDFIGADINPGDVVLDGINRFLVNGNDILDSVSSGDDKNKVIVFDNAADTWECEHNLGKLPSIQVFNYDTGEEMDAEVEVIDLNNVTIRFYKAGSPFDVAGKAVFN